MPRSQQQAVADSKKGKKTPLRNCLDNMKKQGFREKYKETSGASPTFEERLQPTVLRQ